MKGRYSKFGVFKARVTSKKEQQGDAAVICKFGQVTNPDEYKNADAVPAGGDIEVLDFSEFLQDSTTKKAHDKSNSKEDQQCNGQRGV
jgi:hypothetical protein